MANNELSGSLVSLSLINYFKKKTYKTLRFIFIPETIGSIVYISENFKKIKNFIGGYNLSPVLEMKENTLACFQSIKIQLLTNVC